MNKQDIAARKNNLSRRTHSHSWDKEGYLTVTTEVSSLTDQRSETFQNVYQCAKSDTDLKIKLARAEATDIFLAVESEEVLAPAMATTTAAKTAVVEAVIEKAVEEVAAPVKKKRASRAKKPVEAAPVVPAEAPIHIAAEVAAPTEDDGLGDLGEEVVGINYTKGDKLHSKILGALLVSAYGKDWQKDEKVKVIVRSLVSAIKDTVPVVDSEGTMLESFAVFVAEFLKKAA